MQCAAIRRGPHLSHLLRKVGKRVRRSCGFFAFLRKPGVNVIVSNNCGGRCEGQRISLNGNAATGSQRFDRGSTGRGSSPGKEPEEGYAQRARVRCAALQELLCGLSWDRRKRRWSGSQISESAASRFIDFGAAQRRKVPSGPGCRDVALRHRHQRTRNIRYADLGTSISGEGQGSSANANKEVDRIY